MATLFIDEKAIETYFSQKNFQNNKAILQIVNKKQLLNSLIFLQNIRQITKEKFYTVFIVDESVETNDIKLISELEKYCFIIKTSAIHSIYSFINSHPILQHEKWANGLPYYKIFAVKLINYFNEVIYLDYDIIAIRDIFTFTKKHNNNDMIISFCENKNIQSASNMNTNYKKIAYGHFITFFKSILLKCTYDEFFESFCQFVENDLSLYSIVTEEKAIFDSIKKHNLSFYVEDQGYITGNDGLDLYSKEFLNGTSIDKANFSPRFANFGILIHFAGNAKPWNSLTIQTVFPEYKEYIKQIKQKLQNIKISSDYLSTVLNQLNSFLLPKLEYDNVFRQLKLLKLYKQISSQFDCIFNSKCFYLEETNATNQIIIWSRKSSKDTRIDISSRGIGWYNMPNYPNINITVRTFKYIGTTQYPNVLKFYNKLNQLFSEGYLNTPNDLLTCFTICINYHDFRFVMSILDKFFEENWELLL